jgi:NADPH-dependent curcumin reductase CurA
VIRPNLKERVLAVKSKQVRLARRPTGMIQRDDFQIVEESLPALQDGEVLVRVEYVSLDPAMRGWVSGARSYVEPVGIGQVMRSFSAGHVEASRNPQFREGDAVAGLLGVQSHAITDGRGISKVDESLAPLPRFIGGLGMPGLTAYFGLLEIGKPQAGETVVVSAAAGAVGSLVGQIAKIQGARAVGIAGGPEKASYVTETLGFDACVDYKAGHLERDVDAACPNGIDVYFENVGGPILDAVLPRMRTFGRIPFCGMISALNAAAPPPGPANFRSILVNRLTVRGFIVFDFAARNADAFQALASWHAEGKLVMREDVREASLEDFADVLNLLYKGGNFGKLVLKLT